MNIMMKTFKKGKDRGKFENCKSDNDPIAPPPTYRYFQELYKVRNNEKLEDFLDKLKSRKINERKYKVSNMLYWVFKDGYKQAEKICKNK